MLQFNPVMAVRCQAMTQTAGAQADAGSQPATADAAARARRAKARVACAAALPRWIYCPLVHGTCWDPAVAAGGKDHQDAPRYLPQAA